MNKYSLKFTDNNVEKDFQSQKNDSERLKTFKLVSLGLVVGFSVKGVQAFVQNNNTRMLEAIVIIVYLLIQLCFVWFKHNYTRVGFITINYIISVYLFAREEKSDSQMAMLQGINQMCFSILMILTGEFLEGIITIVNLTIFRIGWTLHQSNDVQYSGIVSHILLLYYIYCFSYQFHKGKRSQFILSVVDVYLEEVLKKLSSHLPYLILQFQEESFDFITKQFNICEKIFKDKNLLKQTFIKDSSIKGIPLRDYLFNYIVSCRKNNQSLQKLEQILQYKKQSFLIELLIYQAKELNILIIFKDINKNHIVKSLNFEKRSLQLAKMFMKSLQIIQKYTFNKKASLNLQRKIKILIMSEKLQINHNFSKIYILSFIDNVLKYCQSVKIKLMIQIPQNYQINTHPSLFSLLLLIIFDNTVSETAKIFCNIIGQNELQLSIKGQFDLQSIQKMISLNNKKFEIIFKEMSFQKFEITLNHFVEIYVPFSLSYN